MMPISKYPISLEVLAFLVSIIVTFFRNDSLAMLMKIFKTTLITKDCRVHSTIAVHCCVTK